jgi:hypothetical protein
MTVLAGEPSTIDVRPSRYIEEFGFRSTRLNAKDLRAIAAEVGNAPQRWTCSVAETLAAPDHVRRRRLTEWTTTSLEDLLLVAPAGRIFHFEFETDVGGNSIRLVLGGPWSKTHRPRVSVSHGPGSEVSTLYSRITQAVHVSAKRGRFWHTLSSFVYGAVVAAAVGLWLTIFRFYMNTPEHNQGAAVSAAAATVCTAFLIAISSPLWVEGFKRLTASSVKLKPSVVVRRTGSSVRRTWAWIRSLYSRDGNLEYKSYLATHMGWIFGAVSTVIAILAWLYPRGN